MPARLSALLSVVLACALSVPAAAGAAVRPGVVGGHALRVPGYMGFVVAVTGGRHVNVCGGTAIRPNVLLTAAHCLVDGRNAWVDAEKVHLLFGLDDPWGTLQGPDPVADRTVAEYVTPSGYGVYRNGATVNDIAVLRLRDRAPASVRLLPRSRARLASVGRPSVVLGWGTESGTSHQNSSSLRRADLTIQSGVYCSRFVPAFDPSRMLCAQSPSQSACHGDSGGPLLVSDAARRLYVAGVVSFGVQTCRGGLPGYFANVSRGPLASFVSRTATRLQRKADAEPPEVLPPAPTVDGIPDVAR